MTFDRFEDRKGSFESAGRGAIVAGEIGQDTFALTKRAWMSKLIESGAVGEVVLS
jgi:hypothetical protein